MLSTGCQKYEIIMTVNCYDKLQYHLLLEDDWSDTSHLDKDLVPFWQYVEEDTRRTIF